MNINYIILAHKAPVQLQRLVSRLMDKDVHFFVHVDLKSKLQEFKQVLPESDVLTYVADRQNCRWGDLSLVDAVIASFRELVNKNIEGFCVLLSAQDYPLRSIAYIKDFFEQHANQNFISIYPIPDPKKETEGGGLERLLSYTFDCRNPKNARMKAKIQPLSLRLKTIGGFVRLAMYRRDLLPFAIKAYFKRREYPKGLAKCFNEMWVALNYRTVRWLLDTIDCHSEYRDYYQYTHIPDETMFGAIMMADDQVRKTIRPMCHYIRWEEKQDGSPKTLTIDDVDDMKVVMAENDQILFARKFEENSEVLDYIDKHFLHYGEECR